MTARSSSPIHSERSALAKAGDSILAGLLTGLIRVAELSSLDRCVDTGARFGRSWARLRMPRTRRVEAQLREAFPERAEHDIHVWTSGVFEHFGRSLAELILLRGRHRTELLESVETEGFEHFIAAEKASSSGGVLVVTAHYGNWELAGMSVARRGIPISAIFRGLDNPVLDAALLDMRRGEASGFADYEQIRVGRAGLGLVRSLRAGRKVFVLLDQNARRDEGVCVPFFGRPACVRTGAVRVAMRLGIPILPAFIRRNPNGHGHRITVHPALPLAKERGAFDAERLHDHLAELTALIEAEIRKDPAQWIWTHRRWRTRPGKARDDSSKARLTGEPRSERGSTKVSRAIHDPANALLSPSSFRGSARSGRVPSPWDPFDDFNKATLGGTAVLHPRPDCG